MATLKKIRTRKGLSQVELAHLAGVSSMTIFLIEAGATRRPQMTTLLKLAGALEVEPGELMEGKT